MKDFQANFPFWETHINKQTGFSTSINVPTISLCESNIRLICYSENSELLRTEFADRFQDLKIYRKEIFNVSCTTQF
jgi:hypothetical protein